MLSAVTLFTAIVGTGSVISSETGSESVTELPPRSVTDEPTVNGPSFKDETSTSVAVQLPSACTTAVVDTSGFTPSLIVTVTVCPGATSFVVPLIVTSPDSVALITLSPSTGVSVIMNGAKTSAPPLASPSSPSSLVTRNSNARSLVSTLVLVKPSVCKAKLNVASVCGTPLAVRIISVAVCDKTVTPEGKLAASTVNVSPAKCVV